MDFKEITKKREYSPVHMGRHFVSKDGICVFYYAVPGPLLSDLSEILIVDALILGKRVPDVGNLVGHPFTLNSCLNLAVRTHICRTW